MVSIVTGNGLGLQSSSALGLGDRGKLGNATFGQTGEKIYVNAATGNLIIQDRDQMLLGQGLNGAVYRAYNSLGQVTGDHWRPGGTRTVDGLTGSLNAAGSTVTLTDWDGSTILYQYDATRRAYVSTTGASANVALNTGAGYTNAVGTGARPTLQFDVSANTWQWRDGQGNVTETYDASHEGRLVSRQDKDGNTVSYVYNATGRLSQVVTAGGDVTHLDYNAAGRLTALRSVTHEAGGHLVTSTAVRYAYDTQGRLSQVIVDLSPDDNSIADGRIYTTTYAYDGTSSRIASIGQSDGSRVSFTYVLVDGDYRVETISERSDGNTVRVTKLSYYPALRITKITDPNGDERNLYYDVQGRLVKNHSTGTQESFTYDAQGNLTYISTLEGRTVSLNYDASGNLIYIRDSQTGVTVTRVYGPNNELLVESYQDQDPAGSATRATRYVYDASGHLRYAVSSEGRVTEFKYNTVGQKISEVQYTRDAYDISGLAVNASLTEAQVNAWVVNVVNPQAASRADYAYDYRGNVSSMTRYAQLLADGTGDTSGEISQSRYIYDPAGRLLQHIAGTPGQEKVEHFAYDGLGRLLSTTNFAGFLTLYQHDDGKHTLAITYSNGLTRTSTYNAAGEVISVTDAFAGQIVSKVQNYYDSTGHLRMSIDANGQATHYLYNRNQGVLEAEIGPDGTLTEYVYAWWVSDKPIRAITYATKVSAEKLASLVNADGSPVLFKNNFMLTLGSSGVRPPVSADDRSVWSYYYRDNQYYWVDHTVDSDGVVTQMLFDGAGRVVTKTVFANRADVSKPSAALPAADPANDRTTRYFYDGDGLLLGELDANGYLTEYRYSGAGAKIETIRYAKTTDPAQRAKGSLSNLRPVGDAQDVHLNYVYDGQGRLSAEIDGEGYVTRYRYDTFGNVIERIRGQKIDVRQLSAPQQMTVNFRASVNATLSVDVWIDGVKAGTVSVKPGGAANYSVMVTSAVPLANHTIEFRYGNTRNGLSITEITLDDQQGQSVPATPWFMAGMSGAVAARFTFDVASALAQAATPGKLERTTYAYDAMGRLLERTEYSASGNTTAQYRYDDHGNLIAETAQNRTLSYRYDAQGRLVGQLTGEGSAKLQELGAKPTQAQIDAIWSQYGVTYRYDAAGNRVGQVDANGNTTLYYYDIAGRLSHIVNPMGEVVAYEYDAFGDLTQTTVYATRLNNDTLAGLKGGLLDDTLRTTFGALTNDQASITRFNYSSTGRLTQRTDALGNKTNYVYNTFGDQTSVTQDIGTGKRTITTFDYDRVGQLIRQTTDAGGLNLITQAIYDAFGRPIQTTDANGAVRRQQYDRNGNVVVLTDGTGAQSKLTYDAFGNVLTSTDRTGATTSYTYSAFNREITVISPEGVRTTTSYDALGQLIALTDGRGNTTTYRYDLDGSLVEVTDPTGAKAANQYDRAGQLIETTDARGIKTILSYDAAGRVLTRTVDPAGLKLTTTYAYDAKGQLISTTDPSRTVTQLRYDLNGQQVAVVVDPDGLKLTTTFTYDATGRVLTVTEGEGSAAPRVTRNTYDNAGRLVSQSVDPEGLNLTARYMYDKAGNVVATLDAAGGVTRYVYDNEGRQIYSIDPKGAVVRQHFDAEGRLVRRNAYAKLVDLSKLPEPLTAAGLEPLVVADGGHLMRYVYDKDGRLSYTVDALSQVISYGYDANGNVVSTVHHAGAIDTGYGILSKTEVSAALARRSSAVAVEDRITRTVFDAADRARYTVDALGNVTHNWYDASGNLIGQTQLAARYTGQPTEADISAWEAGAASAANDRTTTWVYDAAGRQTYAIDAEGYVTESRYDSAGHLTQTLRYAAADPSARALNASQLAQRYAAAQTGVVTTQYRYDAAGRLIEVVDARNNTTRYVLDALGQATDTIVAHGTEHAATTHRDYDAAGRLLSETRAWGTAQASTTQYIYDGVGRVLTVTDPNKHTTRYDYDAQGNRISVTDPLGYTTRYDYDAFGNAVKVTDARGNATYFYFDRLNRNVLQVNAVGGVIATEYSASGQPTKVTQFANAWTQRVNENTDWTRIAPPPNSARDAVTQLTYDKLDRLVQSTDAEGYSEYYGYDAFGNRTSYTNKLTGTFAYTYDKRGLMLSETLPITSGGRPVINRFEYDARGNRITTTEAAGLPEQRTTRVAYDALDREISRTGDAIVVTKGTNTQIVTPTETKAYDPRGNLIRQTDANGNTTAWYYDAADRRIAQIGPDGAYTVWAYDAAGNMTAERRYAELVTATDGATPPVVPERHANTRETQYTYDAANRLTSSTLLNVATGALAERNGEYIISEGSIVRRWEYDALGNVAVTLDGNGNRSVTLWDPRGPWKAMEIDAMGYATRWVHDAQGNVLQEIRYASPYLDVGSIGASTNPDQLAKDWPTSPEDRITTYTWDRNGRMTSEARQNVAYAEVDALGRLTERVGEARTSYVYDGEGHLLKRTDANNQQREFTYDALGRQTGQILPQFLNYQNQQVRSTTLFEYDGLNNIVRETRQGGVGTTNQVDTYSYGAGGRLMSKTNSVGLKTEFGYDAVGNTTLVSYARQVIVGFSGYEDKTYINYDANNREVSRQQRSYDVSSKFWRETGPVKELAYNAFGEITGRRTRLEASTNAAWQEYAEYNNAGNVIRTNFDDGISHVYMYDRNGNATLQVESMAADLRTYTINDILRDLPLNQTFTGYDARNQVTEIRQPKVFAGAPQVTFSAVEIHIDGGKFANTQLSVGGWLGKPQDPVVVGPALETEAIGVSVGGNLAASTRVDWKYTPPYYGGSDNPDQGFVYINGFNVDLPDLLGVIGAYEVEVKVSYTATLKGTRWGENDQCPVYEQVSDTVSSGFLPGSTRSLSVPVARNFWGGHFVDQIIFGRLFWGGAEYFDTDVQLSYSVEIYTRSSSEGGEPRLLGALDKSGSLFRSWQDKVGYGVPIGGGRYGDQTWAPSPQDALDSASVLENVANTLTVANGTLPEGAQGMLYYRRAGTSEGFQPLPKSDTSTAHSYRADIGGLSAGNYELVFIATSDGSDGRTPGTLLRRDAYLLTVPEGAASTIELNQRAPYVESGFQYNETGSTLWQAPGLLNLYAPQTNNRVLADLARARLRDPVTNAVLWEGSIIGRDAAGAFAFDFTGIGAGNYQVEIDLLNAAGEPLDRLISENTTLGMGTPTFNFLYLSNKKTSITFHNQPANTRYLRVSWMQADENGELQKKYATVVRNGPGNGLGDFVWDTTADGLLPDPALLYTYEIDYTAFNANDRPLSMGRGEITIGTVGETGAVLTGSENIPYLEFKPISPQGNVVDADTITLYYRPAPKKDEDYDTEFKEFTLQRDADGKFLFNASDLPTDAEFEYRYTARNATGAITLERSGFFLTGTRSFKETNTDIQYIIEQTARNKDMTIDRNQLHNAFGDVSVEIDGNGNATQLFYNTNGNLVLKQEPEVSVTLANGFVTKIAPQTRFYYDRTGNLVGLKDANGHLSTQQWNYGIDQPAVGKSWDAQGNARVFQYDGQGNLRIATDEIGRRTDYTYDAGNRLTQVQRPRLASGDRISDFYTYDTVGNRITHQVSNNGQYAPDRDFLQYDYDQNGRVIQVRSPAGRSTLYRYEWVEGILGIGDAQTGGWRKTTAILGLWGVPVEGGDTLVDDTDVFGRLVRHEDRHGFYVSGKPQPTNHVTTYRYNYAGMLSQQTSDAGQHIEYAYYGNGRLRSVQDKGTGTEALYEYDGNGNRTYESFRSISGAYVFSQAYVQYDALNRVTQVKDLQYTVRYEYDAVGNRRHMEAEYHDPADYHNNKWQKQEYWYEYDSENRFTVTQGQLSGGQRAQGADDTSVKIVKGEGGQGVQLGYNAAGERTMAVYASDGRTELYTYDGNGYLIRQTANGILIQQRDVDAYGRAVRVQEWDPAGSGKALKDITRTYDADGLVLTERDHVAGTTTTNTYTGDGVLKRATTISDDPKGTNLTTDYEYEWWDGPKQKKVTTQGTNPNSPGWKPSTSTYNYDVNGNLKAVLDDGGGQAGNGRAFLYWTDQQGQVLRRDEVLGAKVDAAGQIVGGTANRQHSYYYLNGHRIGNVGNDGIEQIDYVQELAGKLGPAGDNDYKLFQPVSGVDFDENFLAINGTYPGLSPTVWTVREGDTLQAIASAMWGDETLWYILADANGLKSTDTLKAGQLLRVPNKVTNIHNTATTFKPYDPGRAIGNTQPTLPDPPPPPGKGGCGPVASIISVIVAVVATIATGGGALGAAIGSLASQGVMIAAGEQKGLNWKSVGLSAIAGGVAGGIGYWASGTEIGQSVMSSVDKVAGSFGQGAVQGALRSVATQGVSMVTGMQRGFDWKSVAVSAVASGTGAAVSQGLGNGVPRSVNDLASGLAAGAASTLARGGSLQRNIGAITTDAIAATIGNMVVDKVQGDSIGKTALSKYSLASGNDSFGLKTGGDMNTGLNVPESVYTGWDVGIAAAAAARSGIASVYGDTQIGYSFRGAGDTKAAIPQSVRAGDHGGSLERIARAQLGANAIQREISNYVGQMFELNGITDARRIGADQRIQLPGAETPMATSGLSAYGKDIALGERMKVAAQAASTPDDGQPAWSFLGASREKLDRDHAIALETARTQLESEPKLVAGHGMADRTAAYDRYFAAVQGQPLGGLFATGALLAFGDPTPAAMIADATEPLDSMWAPGGVGRARSAASIRRDSVLSGAKAEIQSLRNASQSPSGRNVDFLINERAAAAELLSLEGSVKNAHFVSRHGPETTLAEQRIRANQGVTPDGVQGRQIDASRWSTYQDMSEAIKKAQTIYSKTGQTSITVDLGRAIGDGYLKGGVTYMQTTKATIRFDASGMPYTAYPKLR